MLHILLLILKIIGIILLAILGLLLVILLAILFVPVRYKGKGSYYEKPEGSLRITWLLHIFSVQIAYREELMIAIRLFGVRLFKEKGEKAEEDLFEEPMLAVQEVGESFFEPKLEEAKQEADEEVSGALKPVQRQSGEHKRIEKPEQEHKKKSEADKTGQEKNIFARCKNKLKHLYKRALLAVQAIMRKLKRLDEMKETAEIFLSDVENQKTIRLLFKQIKAMFKHLLPGMVKGSITFGFEEPYTTGQILTWAACFYPIYKDNLILKPVFDRQIVEGDIAVKGRIRAGTLLFIGLRVLLNKNFRKQLKYIRSRGGKNHGR